MAYSERKHIGGTIRDFWPDDSENQFYLPYGTCMSDILEKISSKFGPTVSMDDIEIAPEYIHTSCLGYDRYDSSDYTNFLCITWNKPA